MKNILILLVMSLLSCSVSKLNDVESSAFVAVATQGDYDNKIEVSWIDLPIYDSYQIYRSSEENGTYESLANKMKQPKFIDTNIETGRTYFYQIRGYNSYDVPIFLTDAALGFAGAQGGFYPPNNVKASQGTSINKIVLEWNRVSDAVEYEVWRSDDGDFFEMIGKTKLLRYEDLNLEKGRTYFYQLSSVNEEGQPSPNRSQTVKGTTFGGDIGLNSIAGAYDDRIELSWQAVPEVVEYVVFRSVVIGDTGTYLGTVSSKQELKFVDNTAKPAQLYYYTVVYKNQTALLTSSQVRSYLKVTSAPEKPQNISASQGNAPNHIDIRWDPVQGASGYEILRSGSKTGPWQIISTGLTATSYRDVPPLDTYVYYYKIIALNPALGPSSDIVSGWANRPPSNIKASDGFGNKVMLIWDNVPSAKQFNISFSLTENGTYTFAGSSPKPSFEHMYDIGNNSQKTLFYKIAVVSESGLSDTSTAVSGIIKKVTAPENVRVLNNKQAVQSLDIQWNPVQGARSYVIYRAVLKHKDANPMRLTDADFKKVADVQNAFYQAPLTEFPLRRYVYRVAAIDRGFAPGLTSATELAWRLPATVDEFVKDVDFTIIHAQKQVRNFGDINSSGNIRGRAHGLYDYYAGMSGSKSNWNNYSSFEIILHGSPQLTVSFSPLGASMTGDVNISGLYTGRITYHSLLGAAGGYTIGGSISAEYNHPTQGVLRKTWNYNEAGSLMLSVVLRSESKPSNPVFEEGGG